MGVTHERRSSWNQDPFRSRREVLPGVVEAARKWRDHWRAKMEAIEVFVGTGGGWGVFNTADEVELSRAMMEMPLALFSVVHVHPTVDDDDAISRTLETLKKMAG